MSDKIDGGSGVMGEEKRYGDAVIANGWSNPGWTLDEILSGKSVLRRAAQELARDLLSAQSRIDELEKQLAETQARCAKAVEIATEAKRYVRIAQDRKSVAAEKFASFDELESALEGWTPPEGAPK